MQNREFQPESNRYGWAPLWACLLLSPLLSGAAAAQVVINEIDYDQVGTDAAEFIELKNTGATSVNLDSFTIKLINGGAAIPEEYAPSPIDLPDVDLAPGDYFVISGDATKVANTDFVVGSFTIQNGMPDAMQLLDGAAIEDTVSYEGTTTGFSEGTGATAADDVTPNIGLSRFPDGADTDDNDTDISLRCITPGEPNSMATVMCPTPLIVRATKTDSLTSVLGVSGDVDADGLADPGDTVSYTVEIETLGAAAPDVTFDDVVDTNTTFVPGSVRVTPIALDDGYDATCNASISVPAGSGVLANDTDPDAVPPLSNTGVTAVGLDTGATSGAVTLATDGSFTYEPSPGFTGIDTFAYTARDATTLDSVETGVVSVSVGTDCIWFIDNTPAGAGNMGTLSDPFSSIASFNAAQGTGTGPQVGDLVLLYSGAYTTGANLLASQTFVGQGTSFTGAIAAEGITLAPNSGSIPSTAGTRPTITSTDDGIDLASGNTIRGLNIGNTSLAAFGGSGVGTLTVDTLAITGTGGALDITTGTLAVTLDSISSTSTAAGTEGIFLSGVGGTLNVTGASSLTGLMDDGIELVSNTATLDFDGSLSIATGSGGGILAAGGTIDVANTATTVSATGGPALSIASTVLRTAGASGITFASLTSASSSSEGIQLSGLTDNLTVTGTTDIDDSTNEGIEIDGTAVTYTFGTTDIEDSGGNGIDLNGLTGTFSLTSAGGGITFNSATNNNHGVLINNCDDVTIAGTGAGTRFDIFGPGRGGGTSSLTSDAEGFQGIMHLNSGDLTVNFVEITDVGVNASLGGVEHGVFVFDPDLPSTITITNNKIDDVKTDAVEVQTNNLTGLLTVDISDNDIDGQGVTAGTETTDIGIDIDVEGGTNAGRLLATVNDNTIDDVNSAAIALAMFGDAGGTTKNSITMDGNTIRDFDADGIAISIFDDTKNIIDIVDLTLDCISSPIGASDPNVGIDFIMDVLDLTGGPSNDLNTSETDLTIRSTSGGTTTITDCTDEGILIRNFGDDGVPGDNNGIANVRIGSATAGQGITSSGHGNEGLQVEAGGDGEINLHVQNSTFTSNSGDMVGDRDVLIGVRSSGNRTIDSYIADTVVEHEIRIETDGDLATTHRFGCDDNGVAPNTCGTHIGSGLLDTVGGLAAIESILTENGVAFGTLNFNDGSPNGDLDIVDETVILGQTP